MDMEGGRGQTFAILCGRVLRTDPNESFICELILSGILRANYYSHDEDTVA